MGNFRKNSPKKWSKVLKKKYFAITIKLFSSERCISKRPVRDSKGDRGGQVEIIFWIVDKQYIFVPNRY